MIAVACTKKLEVKPPDPKTEKVPTLQKLKARLAAHR